MTPSAQQWADIHLVAQAILDQAKQRNLDMVKDRHAYLGKLLDEMQEPEAGD